MGVKQINIKDRITFLKRFTRELILNYVKEDGRTRHIEIEKIRQKFIQPPLAPEVAIGKVIKSPAFQPSQFVIKPVPILPPARTPSVIRPISTQISKPKIGPAKPLYPKESFLPEPPEKDVMKRITPEYQPKPQGFHLGKVEILLRDPTIESIECQGPGKNLLVRRRGKISSTKIALTPNEISSIINDFSAQAKIPLVGGILKAAVGNLVISAVTSEFVGSRFIISSLSPSLARPVK